MAIALAAAADFANSDGVSQLSFEWGLFTYREIAQVLYGDDRVSEMWIGESRFMKDKVRRAVERGSAFMEGEYVRLLQ